MINVQKKLINKLKNNPEVFVAGVYEEISPFPSFIVLEDILRDSNKRLSKRINPEARNKEDEIIEFVHFHIALPNYTYSSGLFGEEKRKAQDSLSRFVIPKSLQRTEDYLEGTFDTSIRWGDLGDYLVLSCQWNETIGKVTQTLVHEMTLKDKSKLEHFKGYKNGQRKFTQTTSGKIYRSVCVDLHPNQKAAEDYFEKLERKQISEKSEDSVIKTYKL